MDWKKVVIFGGLGIIVVFFGVFFFGTTVLNYDIAKINNSCPRQLDEVTYLVKVELDSIDTVSYHYVLADEVIIAGALSNAMGFSAFNDAMTVMGCTTKIMDEYGLDIRAVFYDTKGNKIVEKLVTEKNCKDFVKNI